MEVTSLIDHLKTTTGTGITTEWGLSLHLQCSDFSMLFDMGPSGHFMDNAAARGIDIHSVDLAVLPHGHHDHGGGLRSFLVANSKAVVYMGKGADAEHSLPTQLSGGQQQRTVSQSAENGHRAFPPDALLLITKDIHVQQPPAGSFCGKLLRRHAG
jgi:metal-dependent hydrolase (beta-lactamase superfamily II)